MSKLSLLVVLVAVFVGSSASAHAQESAAVCAANASSSTFAGSERAGYRRHDGFYLRMLSGGGVGGSKYREGLAFDGAEARTLGSSATTEIAVGWAILENFIAHATLNVGAVHDEKRKLGKRDYKDDDQTTVVGFFGGGLTYYLMPANVYVTGSVGLGGIGEVSDDGHDHHESKVGLGTSFALGKEWWLGRSGQWGLGVALTGAYYQGPLEIDHVKSTYRGFTSGVALSATLN